MVDRTRWSQLGGLLFQARRLVEGLWAGGHASMRLGSGMEFHDYRAQSPGEDVSEVDWKLFGRTDRLYVRRRRQLTDLAAYLLVDHSASMNFAGLTARGQPVTGPTAVTKLSYASELAAAIAYLTIRQSDRAGLGLFADRLTAHIPPGGTWPHLQRICAALEATHPVAGVGNLAASLKQAHAALRRPGLVVLISDLLDEPVGLFEGLARLRHHRFDVLVFQILTRQELDLSGLEPARLQLVDSETRRTTPTQPAIVRGRYARLMADHITTIRRGCAARQVAHHLLTTDQDIPQALRRFLAARPALAR